jgi:hypothetical protein
VANEVRSAVLFHGRHAASFLGRILYDHLGNLKIS